LSKLLSRCQGACHGDV